MKKKKYARHGNGAQIDPHKEIISAFESLTVTMADGRMKDSKAPIVNHQNVADAKKFVDTNHK